MFNFNFKFIVIRHKVTNEIWAAAMLPYDQDNYVCFDTPDVRDWDAQKDFDQNFGGTGRNAKYFSDTMYFKVEYIEKKIEIV